MILKILKLFEKTVVLVLAVLLAVAILFSLVDLITLLARDLFLSDPLGLQVQELLEVFGLFLMVLLGLELLETIKAYLREDVVHVEVVMLVAVIAIARKIIILDIKDLPFQTMLGLAALLAALAGGYLLIKRSHHK